MSKFIIAILILFFNVSMFIFPKEIIDGTRNGLNLWLNNIIPVLLPFVVFNNILRETKVLASLPNWFFKPISKILSISINTSKYYILAIFTGYPLGLKISSELYENKEIKKEELLHIIKFFNNASIVFIVGTIGITFYNNKYIGILLYIVHIFSSIILGILYSKKVKPTDLTYILNTSKNNNLSLSECIINAFYTIINIGSFVIFFSFVGEVLETSKVLHYVHIPFLDNNEVKALLLGLLEFTNGIHIISSFDQTPLSLPIISFLLGFGGLSVTMQSISFLKNINISPMIYIKSKLQHGLLASILTYFITKYFYPYSQTTIKIENHFKDTASRRYLHNDFLSHSIELHPIITMMLLSFFLYLIFYILKKFSKYKRYY